MSKRNAIIIIIAILLVIVGVLLFSFRSANTATKSEPTATNVNPFGAAPAENSSSNEIGSNATSSQAGQSNSANKNYAKLIELYADPVAGSIFMASGSQDVLQFADRGNGNVYQYIPQTLSAEPVRITDTTIPKVEEIVWSLMGDNLIYRYLDGDSDIIDSFSGSIANASTSDDLKEVNGAFLDQNIASIVSDPKGDKIFSLMEETSGDGSYGTISNFDGSSEKQVFQSPVSFWNISWPTNSIIAFNTKPTYENYGFLYFFNTQTDSFQKVLGDMTGLSTLTNPTASLVAYSQSANNAFTLGIYNLKNETHQSETIATLADKCVWSTENPDTLYCAVPQSIPSDNYPDAWYQGAESFSDNIWMINADTGVATELYQTGVNENQSIDAMDLTISPDDTYLAFTNKNDLSLWILNLNATQN